MFKAEISKADISLTNKHLNIYDADYILEEEPRNCDQGLI